MIAASHENRLTGFDLVQADYKTVKGHGIRADFIIPQSNYTGKRPVIIRFHGGGFVTGDSLFWDWFPEYLFDLAKEHDAVIVSANYRLMPEATSHEIIEDIEDLWTWLHSSAVVDILSSLATPTELDLERIITAGESAGGVLSITLALSHPDEIRAGLASYAPVDMAGPEFRESHTTLLPDLSDEAIDDVVTRAVEAAKLGKVLSSADVPNRLDLMLAAIQGGRFVELWERGTKKDSPRALRYPMERLDDPDLKIPRGGLSLRHGLADPIVNAGQSRKFVEKARAVLKGKPGGDKILVELQEGGDHGFDGHTHSDAKWLQENLRFALEAWLE
ncbi:alpha/beta-hydrolase, partial [Aspergillus heteromorphus CBS 117.55]